MSIPSVTSSAFIAGERIEPKANAVWNLEQVDWAARFSDQCQRIANRLNELAAHPDPMVSAWVAVQVADVADRYCEKVFR